MAEMSMVEKVARAMAAAESGPEGSALFAIHWDEFGHGYLDSARVAIEAMSEPNHAMVDAAGGELVPCGDFIPAYRAAIRAALSEHAEINTAGSATNSSAIVPAQVEAELRAIEEAIMDSIDEYRESLARTKYGPLEWPTVDGIKAAIRSALSPRTVSTSEEQGSSAVISNGVGGGE